MELVSLPSIWSVQPPPSLTGLTPVPLPSPWQKLFQADLPDNGSETGRQLLIYFYWNQVFGAVTNPNAPMSFQITVTTGVTNSETESETFTQSLTAGASATLEGLGASVSATVSESLQTSYTQTFSESNSTSTTLSVGPQNGWMAGQWWQAVQVLQYTSSKTNQTLQNNWQYWTFISFGS